VRQHSLACHDEQVTATTLNFSPHSPSSFDTLDKCCC
jgi:hypothetical protein